MRALAVAAAIALAACRSPAPREPPRIENHDAGGTHTPVSIPEYAKGLITEQSLAAFLSRRFSRQLADGTFVADYSGTTEDLLDELRTMGIRDLADLAAMIPPDFEIGGAGEFILEDPANIPGLVRDFMMIHDARRYFGLAWKNRWHSILPANVSALKNYVSDFRPFYDAKVLTPEEVRDAPPTPRPTYGRPAPGAAQAQPSPHLR
jgi:hypothetical protein